ncbi:tail chaperonin [Escherichia phage Shy]|nr:tail chaperonin [Escherichia phage Shy]
MPDRIANAPELELGLQLYLQAFFDLDSERSHSLGLTPISWSSIIGYARAFEFDEEQTESLLFHIRRMDTEHLKRLESKQPKQSKQPVKVPKHGR